MRKLLLTICFIGFFAVVGHSQCTQGSVCVPQTTVDKCAKAADELLAARDALAKLTAERDVSAVAIKAAQTAIDSLQTAITTGRQIQADQQKIIEMYQTVVKSLYDIIDKQAQMLNKPKSAWAKFVRTLEKIAVLAIGISIGRGL